MPQLSRKASGKAILEYGSQSTTPRASTAASSDAGAQTDRTKVDETDRLKFGATTDASRQKYPLKKPGYDKRLSTAERYWNEYDDPSDDDENYVIYMDPNYESMWDKAWKFFGQMFRAKHEKSAESEPLLYSPDLESGSFDEIESSDDEAEPLNYRVLRVHGHVKHVDARDKGGVMSSVPRLSLTSFASSTAILVVAFILASTGKRKLHTEVDAGVVFAVATSLTFAIIGVADLYRSGQDVRLLVWVVAGIFLCLIAIASGGLLAWILG